jgi:flavodoxin
MKTLVVYFSLDGNCGLIADILKSALNADVLRLEPATDKRPRGLAKYIWGGRQVLFHLKPRLKPYKVSPDAYDLVILGGPVWAGSLVPALDSFLEQTGLSGKRVALFCCHAGGMRTALEKFRDKLALNTLVGEIDFVNPLAGNRGEIVERLGEWIKKIA